MAKRKGGVTLTNEEKILEILGKINGRLDSLESEVKEVHEKMDELAESQAALVKAQAELAESQAKFRTSVNAILDWTDTVSTVVPIVPKIS